VIPPGYLPTAPVAPATCPQTLFHSFQGATFADTNGWERTFLGGMYGVAEGVNAVYSDGTGSVDFSGGSYSAPQITVVTKVAAYSDDADRVVLELSTDRGPLQVLIRNGTISLILP
jgi:hypothetical protein